MLGFAPISATAFADLGSGELLFVATGVSATGAIGDVVVTGDQIGLTLGSVEGTASSNGVTVDGGATAAVSEETGLIGDVGSVIVSAGAGIDVTGVEATGEIDSVTVATVTIASPDGVEGTGELGDVVIKIPVTLTVTGVSGTMAVGDAEGQAGAGVDVTGVSGTGSVGSVTMTGSAVVIPTGVTANGLTGQALVWGRLVPDPGTTWTRIAA